LLGRRARTWSRRSVIIHARRHGGRENAVGKETKAALSNCVRRNKRKKLLYTRQANVQWRERGVGFARSRLNFSEARPNLFLGWSRRLFAPSLRLPSQPEAESRALLWHGRPARLLARAACLPMLACVCATSSAASAMSSAISSRRSGSRSNVVLAGAGRAHQRCTCRLHCCGRGLPRAA